MEISAKGLHFSALDKAVRDCTDREIVIRDCIGQRYLASGLAGKYIEIHGTPGNALGAYLDGCTLVVDGNAQDATGDTMNGGEIVMYGSAGDATGYAMRGGRIFVRGDVGYRCGIHMKAYKENRPAIVIGGRAGSFLGEYQAGGILIVLGRNEDGKPIIGNFCGTGMHGGEIWLRCETIPTRLPPQVKAERVDGVPEGEVAGLIGQWCQKFGADPAPVLRSRFWRLTPDDANPYRRMYTHN